jgi:hypothetical protein
LTAHLFGAAHENVALRAYIFAAAQAGASVPDDELPAWRRALGQGQALSRDPAALERFTERDRKRTERFGPTAAGSFFGRSAALTFRQDPSGSLRNLRSYWSEAILFALIQHAYIEGYAQRLSRLGGEPLGEPVEDLFVQWLAFRNVLWWRSPSFTTPVAGEILQHAHHGLRTERLFAELETGFATYIEQRRHRAEDLEAKTLRRLQVYGAIFAVVSTFAALMQVAGESYLKTSHDRLIAVGGLVAFGIVVLIAATLWLARRDRKGG